MLHSHFFMPASNNENLNSDTLLQSKNLVPGFNTDHTTNKVKSYPATDKKETENAEAGNSDFISFYDIFGAVNY